MGFREIDSAAGRGFGLDAAKPVEVPGGMQEFLESNRFDGALGVELGQQVVSQGGEFFALVLSNDQTDSGEPMPECILGNTGLTLDGARARGMLSVDLVSGKLS